MSLRKNVNKHSISFLLKFQFCIKKDAQLYAELRKVWFVWGFFATAEEIYPFQQR